MTTLESLLAKAPPEELFHYTSQEGLLGILEGWTLWASKISHLNDAAELVLALDLARKKIESKNVVDIVKDQLLDDIDMMSHGSINIFVFSLTANGDQLSQWRGYAPAGAGYSIGFSTGFLTAAAAGSMRFYLGPCSYEPAIHDRVISEIVDNGVSRILNRVPTDASSFLGSMPFSDALYFAAPFLKHEGFSEEAEWRLVSRPISCVNPRFKHRPGRSRLVPYFELPLGDREAAGVVPIRHVIVGPTSNAHLAMDSVATLVGALGLNGCEIRASSIPFRQW